MTQFIKVTILLFIITSLTAACGGGGGGSSEEKQLNDSFSNLPSGLTSQTKQEKNLTNVASFLNRATFGSTETSINNLMHEGSYENWLTTQFNMPPTMHIPKIRELAPKMCIPEKINNQKFQDSQIYTYPRHQIWWEVAVNGKDQLRQRVALALSQILVISSSEGLGLSQHQYSIANYYDILIKHAFGNYRDLLEEVTLNPAMGIFLSMIRNQKEDTETGIRPDENYARELLQLFTIGVVELNLDGTPKLSANGNTIPTYNQEIVEAFAKVFTGWNFDGSTWTSSFRLEDHNKPMVANETYHDVSEKILLNNQISPSGQTAQDDLDFALDNVFEHSNVAPFISKQLIQRLVTSNPSPDYVERVARVFNNNGNGIKGDLKAVIAAILLDENALAENKPNDFGKLREPLLRISHLWRAFDMQTSRLEGHRGGRAGETCGQGHYPYYVVGPALQVFTLQITQGPLGANSVFNFFRPDFSPNGLLNDQGLVAPEFEIMDENTLISTSNLLHKMILQPHSDSKINPPKLNDPSKLNLEKEVALAQNTDELLNHLSLVLLNNNMSSSLRGALKEHLDTEEIFKNASNPELEKARNAILLIISSPEYLIQR